MSIGLSTLMRGGVHHTPLATIVARPRPTAAPPVAGVPAGRRKSHGRLPYGYRRWSAGSLVVKPHEDAVVQLIFRRYIAGDSLTAICADLNSGRIAGTGTRHWSRRTLRYMLANRSYVGIYRLHWSFAIAGPVWQSIPPIVSLARFNAANHRLMLNSRTGQAPRPQPIAPRAPKRPKSGTNP